jgi:hypothetical protein
MFRSVDQSRQLKSAERGERRLGSLVLIGALSVQAVPTATGVGVVESGSAVVGSHEPSGRQIDPIAPDVVIRDHPSPSAGVGHRRSLNGLLIESWARLTWFPPTYRCETEMPFSGFGRDKPLE